MGGGRPSTPSAPRIEKRRGSSACAEETKKARRHRQSHQIRTAKSDGASLVIAASLDSLQRRLRLAWAEAAGIDVRPSGASRVANAFAQAGDRLTRNTAAPLDVAQAGLMRQFGPLRVPGVAEPDVTVIFHARADVASTVGVVRGLARAGRVELMLLDDGRDPRAALLRALAPNLVIVNARGGTRFEAILRAAGMARGRRLALLDDTVQSPSATALAALSAHAGAVVIGPAIMDRAERTGVSGRLGAKRVRAGGRLGLKLCVEATNFARVGVGGWSDDGALDFCLRAHAEGLPVVFHDEPKAGPAAWTR